MSQVELNFDDPDQVARDMSALMILAMPNAVDEFILFMSGMVEPPPASRAEIMGYLVDNPELEDLLVVFEKIAEQEKDDLVSLAGKVRAMWTRIAPMYQKGQENKKALKQKT